MCTVLCHRPATQLQLTKYILIHVWRDQVVMRLWDAWSAVPISVGGKRFLSSPKGPARLWGTPKLLFSGHRCFVAWVKRPECEAVHSPSYSAEVQSVELYLFSPIRLYGTDRENFVLFLRGADKSFAQPGRKQARKHVRDGRDFNNIETRTIIKFFFSPFWQKH